MYEHEGYTFIGNLQMLAKDRCAFLDQGDM